ncbi:T9SS type A sorting domain-containing protein, partial [Psychroserpens mesophilus]|uniref:T9SS type A sorting domain-containing protein n=1 Tax=Psychroserpens mesophilus TaxID=325473 RepID=UPI003F49B126
AIEDAIEITTTSFTDENLRLDLAAEFNEPINGCGIGGFKTVFYKFLAPFSGDAAAVVLNQDGSSASGSIFAIFYSAPNLNITSGDEFIFSETPCVLTPNATNLIISEGQSYYIAISRAEANVLSRVEVTLEEVPLPINDQIIDATEITGNSFNDSFMRLDFASASSGGQIGCDTTQEVVYYKYTATDDGFVSLSLTNNSGSDSVIDTSSFIRVFNAPDLNVTSESDLSLATGLNCNSEINVDVAVESGQSYYFLAHRPDEFQLSSFNFEFIALTNNSLINATEITTSSFTDSNLRLDLASESTGGQIDCSTTNKVLYYKFTADSDTKIFTRLTDDTNNPISGSGSTFINIYEAPNLNITLESELVLAPGDICNNAQSEVNIDITSGQSYYILINRDRAFARTTFSFEKDPPLTERQALVDLYNATGGPLWTSSDNWLSNDSPLNDWEGIRVEDGHISRVILSNRNLTGQIPNSILNLQFVELISLGFNKLSGLIPDFGLLPNLEELRLNGNNFSLGDFETNFVSNSSITFFNFSPQRLIDDYILIENPVIGDDYTLTMTPQEGTNISYQWVKRSPALFEPFVEEVPGANSNEYAISNFQLEDGSTYSCFVTSPLVPGLTIERESIKFRVPVSQSERDALIALYNATDGANWYNTIGTSLIIENWNTSAHVDTWTGVETFGHKVVYLNLNFSNLNGQLPDEIGDLIHLRELRVSANPDLTGPIPSSIGNLSELQWLRLQNNGHTGEIPISIGNLSNLNRLYLSFNELTGTIPTSLGNAPELLQLILEHNQLDGEIPGSLGDLTNLVSIQLNNNNLSGSIPSNIGSNVESMSLDVSFNNLSGPLPEWTTFVNPEFTSIRLQNNFYSFSDLEPLVNNGVTYGSLIYSPQNTLDDEEDLNSPPEVDITLDVNDTDINRNTQDPSPNNQYQWFKDNTIINGANANAYTIVNAQLTDSGVYHCEITNPLVPDLTIVRADINLTVDDNLGVEDFENEGFKLYPNPASNWLSIKTDSLTDDAKAQVFDMNGKLLFEKTLTSEITAIAIDQLAAGIYVITVKADDKQTAKRFIKQ